MRYVTIINPGPTSTLRIEKSALPTCKKDQLLVRVHATALNRADLMQRQGKYPPPPGESSIPGLELAGEVINVGAEVSEFQVGDRVYGLVGSGAYAEYCCVHQTLAAKLPENWDYETAAALPEALVTANTTLFEIGQLRNEQSMLIHAAGSGISSMAIQMAKHYQATVISTASSEEKVQKGLALGADQIINYKTTDFLSILAESSIDLIVDFIGGAYFDKHLHLLKKTGHLVQISALQGRHVQCDLVQLMHKRLILSGFVLRSQSLAEKTVLWQAAQKRWCNALANKELQPIVDRIFSFEEIEEAQQYIQSGKHFGKIVVRW